MRTLSIILCVVNVVSCIMVMVCYYFNNVRGKPTEDYVPRVFGMELKKIMVTFAMLALASIMALQIIFINIKPQVKPSWLSGWPPYMTVIMVIGLAMILLGRAIGPVMRRIAPGSRFLDKHFSKLIEVILRLAGGCLIITTMCIREIQFIP